MPLVAAAAAAAPADAAAAAGPAGPAEDDVVRGGHSKSKPKSSDPAAVLPAAMLPAAAAAAAAAGGADAPTQSMSGIASASVTWTEVAGRLMVRALGSLMSLRLSATFSRSASDSAVSALCRGRPSKAATMLLSGKYQVQLNCYT